jgi:AcrR family transcriptional regulator
VAIAREVLVDHGLERFVMRDVAARAGMTLGNLQYYYPTRMDLLEAVARSDLESDLAAFDHEQLGRAVFLPRCALR